MNVLACLLCLLLVGFLKNTARAQEASAVTCPSRTIQGETRKCHASVGSIMIRQYHPSCTVGGYNTCRCVDLEKAFQCYVKLWNSCAEDPALSGLGWDYSRFINYMFLNTIGNTCPPETFTTTPIPKTEDST